MATALKGSPPSIRELLPFAAKTLVEAKLVIHECQVAIVTLDLNRYVARYEVLFSDYEPTRFHLHYSSRKGDDPAIELFKKGLAEHLESGCMKVDSQSPALLAKNDVPEMLKTAFGELKKVQFVKPILIELFNRATESGIQVQSRNLGNLLSAESGRQSLEEELGIEGSWIYGCLLERLCLAMDHNSKYTAIFFNGDAKTQVRAIVASTSPDAMNESAIKCLEAIRKNGFEDLLSFSSEYKMLTPAASKSSLDWCSELKNRIKIVTHSDATNLHCFEKINQLAYATEHSSPSKKATALDWLSSQKKSITSTEQLDSLIKDLKGML